MQTAQQRGLTAVWRSERRARWFFAAHLQSALGTGAGYVALLLLAYEQLDSAWGATAVLIADMAPAMLLGPLLGGLIDRTSRLGCAIAADVIAALAFAGLVFAHGTLSLIALALAAGVGSALLRPATCALLPAVVHPDRLTAANGVFGAVREIGQLVGPACAAGLLLIAAPQHVLALNAVTFAVSAALLIRLRGHLKPSTPAGESESTGPGDVRGVLRDPLTRSLVLTSGAVMLTAGLANVAEVVLARDELSGGGSGFALLVSAFGCGMLAGSLLGPRDDAALRGRYLTAITALGLGLIGTAASPVLPVAMLAFAIAGIGNGLFLVTGRVLMQKLIPEPAHGRAFGLLDAVDSWGFGAAIVAGGALAATLGGRATFAIAGAATLLVLIPAARAVRRATPFGFRTSSPVPAT